MDNLKVIECTKLSLFVAGGGLLGRLDRAAAARPHAPEPREALLVNNSNSDNSNDNSNNKL